MSSPQPAASPIPVVKTNVLAIVALVLGVLGTNLAAVVVGHIALAQIRRSHENGRVLAVIGLVFGYLGLALLVVAIALWVWVSTLGHVVVE